MLLYDNYRYHHHLYRLLASPTFQQVAPLVILVLIPTLVIVINSYRRSLAATILMIFDSLALIFPWNWSDSSSTGSGSSERERRKLRRKQHTRSRDDQVSRITGQDIHGAGNNDGYYPGLVNISGTYCFMNSTLQAMASLCYLWPQLEKIHTKAEMLDVPTPVIDSLRDLVHKLNAPSSSSSGAYRPVDIIHALSNHNSGKHNSLFSSREHQDAQELFQLLSECIKSEASAVANEIRRDRGLGGLTQQDDRVSRDLSQTVFDGLTANRRSCLECGYTEAVMHFPFDNWQLAVPRLVAACRLEDCLEDYTRLELLTDCVCRKCSMLATYRKLEQEADRLTEASQASNDPASSKKKRARDSRKLLARVKAALDEGRIEEDIRGVKLEKVLSKSTKQSMIARPPPVLALHLNRSMHYGHYATKNNCRVVFPEILDLTPYTTSGQLSTQPSAPISSPPPPIAIQRSVTPTPSTYAVSRTLYRLSAIVCHYGQHSFGHYVCFRRKPRPTSAGDRRFAPPRLACPLGCDCDKCTQYGPLREDESPDPARPGTGRGWLRISDDAVQECGIERVLQESAGAFMLYYERVQQPRPLVYAASLCSSEETVRAEEAHISAAEVASVNSPSRSGESNGSPVKERSSRDRRDERERFVDPRVVRRVSAHKHKTESPSPAPPPISRSTSGNSSMTAVSSAGSKTASSEDTVLNGHAHSHLHPTNGSADPSHPQRPSLPPSKSSQSSRLRKSRKSIPHVNGSPTT